MKKESVIVPVFCLLILLTAIGAYWRGKRDVWIEEFKIYTGNLTGVTSFETNMPPELKEFMKGRYYYLANKLSDSSLGSPYDYGPVSNNVVRLAVGKGPTSAQEEYRK